MPQMPSHIINNTFMYLTKTSIKKQTNQQTNKPNNNQNNSLQLTKLSIIRTTKQMKVFLKVLQDKP
jgi:hypothetical protein